MKDLDQVKRILGIKIKSDKNSLFESIFMYN